VHFNGNRGFHSASDSHHLCNASTLSVKDDTGGWTLRVPLPVKLSVEKKRLMNEPRVGQFQLKADVGARTRKLFPVEAALT
jgi:hypothetical protein